MEYSTGALLLGLEVDHLTRLAFWAGASLIVGAVAVFRVRRTSGPSKDFWRHFGIQCAAWGAVDFLIVLAAWGGLGPRDVAGAIALDRFLWLNVGLDVGYSMVGLTLLTLGLRAPRRLGLAGAGVAIVVQGVALAILDAQLSAYIVR